MRRRAECSASPSVQYLDDPLLKPLEDDDYVAFGLACCFVMNDNLKLDGTKHAKLRNRRHSASQVLREADREKIVRAM